MLFVCGTTDFFVNNIMAKTKQQKQATVKSLSQALKQAKGVVFANFQGLTVAESQELRKKCREQKVQVLAAKKTLVKRACEEINLLPIVDPVTFAGGIATFTSVADEVAAARIVNDFAKEHKVVEIFGGILEGQYIDNAKIKYLAGLPTKNELLTKLVGALNTPISGFVNSLAGNLRNLVNVLNNIKEARA